MTSLPCRARGGGNVRIVLCCFLSDDYLEEARLCIKSIRSIGLFTGRIDFFTNLDTNRFNFDEYDVHCHLMNDVHSVPEAAGYRLRMLELLEWTEDDIFLYVDNDILCMDKMSIVIDHAHTIDDKLHVYGYTDSGPTRRNQVEAAFAGFLTNDSTIITQVAWCSGILMFRPSLTMKRMFRSTLASYEEHIIRGKVNNLWEQPFLCLTFCQHEMYETSLNPFVSEESYNRARTKRWSKSPGECVVFHHYCGLRGAERKEMMRTQLDDLLARGRDSFPNIMHACTK